jgi:hypothetical protein
MHQNIHQTPAPMIPVPQQLTISPAERHHMYDQSLLHNQQQQQQFSPMNTRRQRTSADAPIHTSIPPTIPIPSPEKKTRSRSKKPSVDSQPNEIQQQIPSNINPPITNLPTEIINRAPVQQTINNEQFLTNSSTNVNNGNNIEVNPLVSKSNDEEQKYIEKIREERGDSRSPSVGSSSAKSESVIKEIPLSGERHRLSRSKSPKSRWHHSPSPQQQTHQSATIEEEPNSVITTTNGDNKYVLQNYIFNKKKILMNLFFSTPNEQIEKSSTVTLFPEEIGDLAGDEKKQVKTFFINILK